LAKQLFKDIASNVELVQKEWKSLKEISRPANVPEGSEF